MDTYREHKVLTLPTNISRQICSGPKTKEIKSSYISPTFDRDSLSFRRFTRWAWRYTITRFRRRFQSLSSTPWRFNIRRLRLFFTATLVQRSRLQWRFSHRFHHSRLLGFNRLASLVLSDPINFWVLYFILFSLLKLDSFRLYLLFV